MAYGSDKLDKARKAAGFGKKGISTRRKQTTSKKQMKAGKTPSSQADRVKAYQNQSTVKSRHAAKVKEAAAAAKAQGFRRTKTGTYIKIGGAEDQRRSRMKAQLAREKAGEKKLVTKPKSKSKKNAKAAQRRKKNTK